MEPEAYISTLSSPPHSESICLMFGECKTSIETEACPSSVTFTRLTKGARSMWLKSTPAADDTWVRVSAEGRKQRLHSRR